MRGVRHFVCACVYLHEYVATMAHIVGGGREARGTRGSVCRKRRVPLSAPSIVVRIIRVAYLQHLTLRRHDDGGTSAQKR